MKRTSILIALLTVTLGVQAQMSIFEVGSKEDRADRLYYQFSYAGAINLYQAVLDEQPGNPRVQLRIAESYRKLNQPAKSAAWYAKVIDNDTLISDQDVLHYAEMLSGAGEYNQAKKWFEEFETRSAGKDGRTERYLNTLNNLEVYFKDSAIYDIGPASFNSEGADFSPMFYEDGLVFVTGRETAEVRLVQNIFNWDKEPFLDLFYVGPDSVGLFSAPRPWSEKINTQYHEGPLAFFDNGERVVFTRNNYYKGRFKISTDKINKLQLYSAKKSASGTWEQMKSLPFNSTEYSVGHPTFMADGRTMIFVSDMPGTLGGTDLWQTEWDGNDWSTPLNLGPAINTEGNEMFPFMHQDGILYFASDGQGGLGGLDLFTSAFEEGTWQAPKNMGYPVNTHHDDFGLIMEPNGVQGWFSSNRDSLEGDNIYRIAITREPFLRIDGIVIDEVTEEPLTNATVTMRGTDGQEMTVETDDEARFSFDLNWDVMYRFNAELRLYDQINAPLRKAEDTPEAREPLVIRMKNRCWVYDWVLNNKETGEPVVGANVTMFKKGTGDSIVLQSDN
ncbi:MAG: tetratricopeptide repeat protein, partial [Bacteroidota bacterium]